MGAGLGTGCEAMIQADQQPTASHENQIGLLDGQFTFLRAFVSVQRSRGVCTRSVHLTSSEQRAGVSPYTAP